MIQIVRTNRSSRAVIGPADHGRAMSLGDFERSKESDGYVYELIDGVLCVSPIPDPLHDYWTTRVRDALLAYAAAHPSHLNYIPAECEVVIPGRPGETRPNPDVAGYRAFPDTLPRRWDAVCPLVVVEVISNRRSTKDTVRNRHLYAWAPAMREYWIIQPDAHGRTAERTALTRSNGRSKWREVSVEFGQTYTTRNLPQFSLNLKEISKR